MLLSPALNGGRSPTSCGPVCQKLDQAEADVLAYMSFLLTHRSKLHSTNPIECLNGEIKRRTDVVGRFPHDDAITRLVGAILGGRRR